MRAICASCNLNFPCGDHPTCCWCREKMAEQEAEEKADEPEPERKPDALDPDPKAVARRTDPGTSWEAAHSLKAEKIRESQREVLRLFRDRGPMTDTRLIEIADQMNVKQSPSGLRTRRSELVTQGFLVDSERRDILPSGRRSIIWRCAE